MYKEEKNINLLTSKYHKIIDVLKDINIELTKISYEIEKNQP